MAPDEVIRGRMEAPAAGRPMLSEAELERRRGRPWTLEVVKAFDIGPRMRRLQLILTGDAAGEFQPKPGQEIVLQIPHAAGDVARRHYTIRRYDAATRLMDVDFVLHGHRTPGVGWSLDAKPGDAIDIRGPRGRIGLDPAADWHLFLGDETAIPAILALIEAMPKNARAFAFLEIGTDEDKQELSSAADLTLQWRLRNGAAPGPNNLLLDALAGFVFPAGKGHAIVVGETSNVRNQRHALLARGFDRSQIYAEGYWRPDRIGGHDHVND
ncbi:MAG TPA: siderophore-interacting protein [Stellaceae bacterium]|nr:siderophore-interacting protein [Stellaceae bacterium]